MPPRTVRAPEPPATFDVQLYRHVPQESERTISFTGKLEFVSAVPGPS